MHTTVWRGPCAGGRCSRWARPAGYPEEARRLDAYSAAGPDGDFRGPARACTLAPRREDGSLGHVYWKWAQADLRGMDANWLMYLAAWFVPALLCRATRAPALWMLLGLGLAVAAVRAWRGGVPAVWCFYSVPLLVVGLAAALSGAPATGDVNARGRRA